MNISPNEALAYAQSSQGVRFVRVKFVDRFEDSDLDAKTRKISASARRAYFYKLPPSLTADEKSLVVVQVLDGKFGIGQVIEVSDEPPSTDEYDFTYAMKWVISVIDVEQAKELTKHDRESLKAISRASLRSRVQEISKALGVDLRDTVPQLPLPGRGAPSTEDAEVIDEADRPQDPPRRRKASPADELFDETHPHGDQ